MFDSKKKMKLATVAELSKKMTSSQLRSIDINNALLAYYSNQVIAITCSVHILPTYVSNL